MKALRANPRMRHRDKALKLEELFRLNLVHMGMLLRACNKLMPQLFSREKCAAFVGEYTETAAEYDCGDDDDLRDRRIKELIEDVPYITREKVREMLKVIAMKSDRRAREIYSGPYFFEMLGENLLLMLMQAHYSYAVGAKRFERVFAAMLMADPAGALEWLEETIGTQIESDPEEIYGTIKMLADHRKRERKAQATAKEQFQARRELEALKKYQDEVRDSE